MLCLVYFAVAGWKSDQGTLGVRGESACKEFRLNLLATDTQEDTVIQVYHTYHLQLHTFSTHLHYHLSPILVVVVLHLLTRLYYHPRHHHLLHLHHQVPCKIPAYETIKNTIELRTSSQLCFV